MIPFCGRAVLAHKIDNKGKKNSDLVPKVCRYGKFPLDPAEVRQDKNRMVGGGTGPSVPHASYIFDNQADQRKNL